MPPWYIAFSKDQNTVLRIVKQRTDAIAVACEMLDRGVDVIRLGPMLLTGEQEIDAVSIRQIWRDRVKRH